jgi:GT2 family glycosyltransferase
MERLIRFSKNRPDWGIIEARQIPFEHPKDFDQITLETSFASFACAMLDTTLYEQCGGFDETFFMYVEDVDLSWRIRAIGRKIYYALDTFFYHSKHVDKNGITISDNEKYYSRLSWLILRSKYNRFDLGEPVLEGMIAHPAEGNNASLLADWYKVRDQIVLATPDQLAMATFQDNGNPAPWRWSYV